MSNWDWGSALRRWSEFNTDIQREQEAQEAIKQEVSKRTWYTVKEAADYLDMDDKEFRDRVVNAGNITTHPFGQRAWRKIHHTDLYNYVVQHRQRKGAKKF
jgi:hypothetical protein